MNPVFATGLSWPTTGNTDADTLGAVVVAAILGYFTVKAARVGFDKVVALIRKM